MKKRNAFTLVEVLIVVVIMAILAAAIIPQFSDSSNDAKMSTAEFNWHTLKSQVELYKSQHDGLLPATLDLLTAKTDVNGATGTTEAIIGPYISSIPANPWNNSNTVNPSTTSPTNNAGTFGWYYDNSDGSLWLAGKEGGSFKLVGDKAKAGSGS